MTKYRESKKEANRVMTQRQIKNINFNYKQEPELLNKLNQIAGHQRRSVHNLIIYILTQYTQKIELEESMQKVQPASLTG